MIVPYYSINSTIDSSGSQCSEANTGEMWSLFLVVDTASPNTIMQLLIYSALQQILKKARHVYIMRVLLCWSGFLAATQEPDVGPPVSSSCEGSAEVRCEASYCLYMMKRGCSQAVNKMLLSRLYPAEDYLTEWAPSRDQHLFTRTFCSGTCSPALICFFKCVRDS